ncbi:TPA: hypothetical protein ACTYQ5_003587 [Klebsiella variicola]
MYKSCLIIIFCSLSLSGCARFDFNNYTPNGKGIAYYEPEPYLFVSTSLKDNQCQSTASLLILPGEKKLITPVSGAIGSSNLTLKFNNGMITEVGQNSDTKIPENVEALAKLLPAIGAGAALASTGENNGIRKPKPEECKTGSYLYAFVGGKPDTLNPIPFVMSNSNEVNGEDSGKILR